MVVSRGCHEAQRDVSPDVGEAAYPGKERLPLGAGVDAAPLASFLEKLADSVLTRPF